MSETTELKHKLDAIENLNTVMVESLQELKEALFKVTKGVMDDFQLSKEEQDQFTTSALSNNDEKIDELILKVKNKKLSGIARILKLKLDIEQS